jgi:hypothetical protein
MLAFSAIAKSICENVCPFGRSSVILMPGARGISDRIHAFYVMATFANYLCATVVVPPPCEALDPIHNHGVNVSCSLRWSDYVLFRNKCSINGPALVTTRQNFDQISFDKRYVYSGKIGTEMNNKVIQDFRSILEMRRRDPSQTFFW